MKNKLVTDGVKYFSIVLTLHILGIICLLSVVQEHIVFFGLAILAYTLGLRHALDADHIVAINNSVRKLIQQQKNPTGVGLYFSLGHSTVVFLMVVALAFSIQWAQNIMPEFEKIGSILGSIVSGTFLIMIGCMNLAVLISLYKNLWKMRKKNEVPTDNDIGQPPHGFLMRLTAPLFRFISKSWHVYPIGFLFGLGFDTATEVGLLAISASATQESIPFYGILALPILFAAGMSLVDTADGIFMSRAYHWAFISPSRKIFYNLTITLISVFTALSIGLIEIVQLIFEQANLHWSWTLKFIQLDVSNLGIYITLVFILTWGLSYLSWKRVNDFEQNQTQKQI